ncbi:MAG TPA: beta-ketoacyl synthase N-terminal-like domain-containing protein [Kofleriaceae bacterium]|jgi:3-oxoacyl-[acyl-carrier-protein] synthase II
MEVVVTGIGPLLPNCETRETLWRQLAAGASQLEFEAAPDGERWAVGRVHAFDPDRWLGRFPTSYTQRYHRDQLMYLASLVIALEDARLELSAATPSRVGLYDGTSRGNFDFWYERVREEMHTAPKDLYTRRELTTGTPGQAVHLAAGLLGIRGPAYTFNVTCCSGAVAIGQAYKDLLHGEVDVAFATGHDASLNTPLYHMYRDTGLISRESDDAHRAVRPFGEHSRNAFGEGAITLVLETRAHAESRGAVPLASIGGYKLGNNGGHPLHVDRDGGRVTELLDELLAQAAVAREDIGFVVGHGNAVAQSDRSEVEYMHRVFASRAREVPLLSMKPVYGHLLGGSSALNVAAAVLMLHHRWLAPTANVDATKADPRVDHLADGGRACDATAGLAVSYGLGGANAVTLVRRAA